MLKIIEDDAHGCFVLEPSGSLRKADLDALTGRFDAKVAAGGPTPNLVIHSPRASPPGRTSPRCWSTSASSASHHRQIEKVALVSDARILDIAPRVARLFVAADLRHFPSDGMDDGARLGGGARTGAAARGR